MRDGEMANTDEIPFRKYYGTIDATPLFVVLAGAYYLRTNDLNTIEKLWPNIERALNWSFAAIFTAFAATILTAQARH